MPVKTWDTKADFDGAYRIGLRDANGTRLVDVNGVRLWGNYERRVLFPSVVDEYGRLAARFGFLPADNIAIIGCGFGWAIEALNAAGFPNVWGVDTSAYIQASKDAIDPADGLARSLVSARVMDYDITGAAGRNAFVADALGAQGNPKFDVVILDRVISSLSDVELGNTTGVLKQIAGQTSRLIVIDTPTRPVGQDAGFNWHSIAEWEALINDTSWVFVASGAA